MKIKEAAEKTGLTEKAIRLYEDKGLIAPPVTEKGGRKSIPFSAFEEQYKIEQTGSLLHYLEAVSLYLENTEEEKETQRK